MVTQTDKLPWILLASNRRWFPRGSYTCRTATFHPYMKPGRREDFNLFVEVFEETIKKEARQERKKYPKKFAPPEHSDVVLDEPVFMRISSAVRPWRICHRYYQYCCQGNCQEGRIGLEFCHSTSIPAKSKIMSSFAGYS